MKRTTKLSFNRTEVKALLIGRLIEMGLVRDGVPVNVAWNFSEAEFSIDIEQELPDERACDEHAEHPQVADGKQDAGSGDTSTRSPDEL